MPRHHASHPPEEAPLPDLAQVSALLTQGKGREALGLARRLACQDATPEVMELLRQATILRSSEMARRGLVVEARALLQRLEEEHPDLVDADGQQRLAAMAVRAGFVDALLERLVDETCSQHDRRVLENALQQELTDLSLLYNSTVLPPEHPLRVAAHAVAEAFRAVTSGAVDEGTLALPEVSRRSPLAPWKALLQALAAFHAGRAAECEQRLAAISPASAPARLVPVLRDLLAGRPSPQAQPLADAVQADSRALRRALARLDEVLQPGARFPRPEQDIQRAVQECARLAPGLLPLLRQRITLRGFALGMNPGALKKALGTPALRNATYWRQMAALLADSPEPLNHLQACCAWEEFRKHALHERWFAAGGIEDAALRVRMARTLASLPPKDLLRSRSMFPRHRADYRGWYADQPDEIRAAVAHDPPRERRLDPEPDFLEPSWLYREACAMHPCAEAFEQWATWADRQRGGPTDALEAWRTALPGDVHPVLRLSAAAEKRGALKKAADLLDEAEKLDPLHPAVRRGRMRLLVATALRHAEQGKAHLMEQDARRARAFSAGQEELAALAAALSWAACATTGDEDGALDATDEGTAVLGSNAAVLLVFRSLGNACGMADDTVVHHLPSQTSLPAGQTLATVVARAWSVCQALGLPGFLPRSWAPALAETIIRDGGSLDPVSLLSLAEVARQGGRMEIAWAATQAGLAHGGSGTARFLLLRAQTLPLWLAQRARECATAAIVLARRNHDLDLIPRAVELWRDLASSHLLFEAESREDFDMAPEQVQQVLERERAEAGPPKAPPPEPRRRHEAESFFDDIPEELLDILLRATQPGRRRRRR